MKASKRVLCCLLSLPILFALSLPCPAVVFVNGTTGNDANSGLTNWSNAVATIKHGVAIAAGQPDLTVWVAKGVTYTEIASINVPAGVLIYGGFVGTELPPFDLSTRTFTPATVVQPTVLTHANPIFATNGGGSTIDGFTIQGALGGAQGGAIHCAFNTGITVANDIFQNNSVTDSGGAIFAAASAGLLPVLSVSACSFTGNTADSGGAFYADGLNVLVNNSPSSFLGNTARLGGAIRALNGSLSATGASFTNDTARDTAVNPSSNGGAIYASLNNLNLTRCTFTNEVAKVAFTNGGSAIGGAIAAYGGLSVYIQACKFGSCRATGTTSPSVQTFITRGGAMYINGVDATVRNNFIFSCASQGTGDPKPAFGGGIAFENPGIPTIVNNTFFQNAVTPQAGLVTDVDRPFGLGAAIFLSGSGPANVFNNIVDNSRGTAVVNQGMQVYFDYNLLWHNSGGDISGFNFPNPPNDHNIMKDPVLVNTHLAPFDLHLVNGSPAINTGRNSGAPSTDIDNQPRPFELIVDRGADEIQVPFNPALVDSNGDGTIDILTGNVPVPLAVYYVKGSVASSGNGTSWATAFKTIQEGIDAADLHNRLGWTGDPQVWVAQGTYHENIMIWHGVRVYGGWAGTEPDYVANPNIYFARNVTTHQTTISPALTNPPNHSVVEICHLPQDRYLTDGTKTTYDLLQSVLDGFTVNGGIAELGGDVAIYKETGNISSCKLINGTAALGGGVYMYKCFGIVGDGIGPPPGNVLTGDTTIIDNTATGATTYAGYGGGVYTEKGSPTIFANLIQGNVAFQGGAFASRASAPLIIENEIGCLNNPNTAGISGTNGRGGGVFMDNGSDVEMDKDTIVDNTAQNGTTTGQGGGIWADSSHFWLTNSILAFNAAASGAAIWLNNTTTDITYTDFFSNGAVPFFPVVLNPLTPPTTNLALEPNFVSRATCNYRLNAPTGPTQLPLHAGDPLEGSPNMGAFQDVDPPVSISGAKLLGNGVTIEVSKAVVTAVFADGFYIEDQNRLSGIKVLIDNAPVAAGDVVDVNGVLTELCGERQMIKAELAADWGVGARIAPMLMTNRQVGGGPVGEWTPGVTGGIGPNNVGLLISTTGRVTSVVEGENPYWMIDDGSGVGVKVLAPLGTRVPEVGSNVVGTGISCIDCSGGARNRAIRLRQSSDQLTYPHQ